MLGVLIFSSLATGFLVLPFLLRAGVATHADTQLGPEHELQVQRRAVVRIPRSSRFEYTLRIRAAEGHSAGLIQTDWVPDIDGGEPVVFLPIMPQIYLREETPRYRPAFLILAGIAFACAASLGWVRYRIGRPSATPAS